jgi:hypothetical protein
MEEVQLMHLKLIIPARTSDLIGLTDLRSMKDFWRHMDEEYLDYHALSRSAIADVKSLDRKDSRFLQMMQVKLNNHKKNLDTNNMGHRITSDEMVNEHWVPLFTEMAKEDWIKRPKRDSPLWPHFEAFLETQSQACRERERLGFATPGGAPTHDCTKCKSTYHDSSDCKEQFCLQCRSWICQNDASCTIRRKQRNQKEKDFCGYFCSDSFPYESHTRAESRNRDLETSYQTRRDIPSQMSYQEEEDSYCYSCSVSHPFGSHTGKRNKLRGTSRSNK